MKIILALAIILSVIPTPPEPTNTREQYARHLVETVKESGVYDYDQLRFKTTGTIPSCRQEFYYSLALFSANDAKYDKLANQILGKYLASQVTNPDGPYFGSFYYPELLSKTEGLEWDMFNPIPVFITLSEFGDRVTDANKALALKAFGDIVKGLSKWWYPNHAKPEAIGHTNYHLMYVADLLLASESCGDRLGVSLAINAFENWVSLTKRTGITEFNSPTYLAVDLQALNVIERYGKSKRMQALAMNMTDLILADGLIHFKRPYSMFGANSRSYDVLSGSGKTCRYLELVFGNKFDPPIEPSSILEAWFEHRKPSWLTKIFSQVSSKTFEFSSKWGSEAWQFRKTWFGQSMVLGTSGQAYGSQDRNLVIDRRDGKWVSSFVPVLAINDSPHKLPEMGGGSGLNHPKVPVFTQQSGNKALQLWDVTYNEPEIAMNRLSLAFLFPQSEMLIEDKTKVDSAFAIKSGNDLVMVRPFVSSSDAKTSLVKKDGLMMVEIRLVHDLRGDLGRRFFVGFAVEIAENVFEPEKTFKEWLKKPFEFKVDDSETNVKASFDGLLIDYDAHSKKPLNLPDFDGSVMKSPWTCLDSSGLWTPWESVKF